jgi:uncharacterized protein (TIGR03086 family)
MPDTPPIDLLDRALAQAERLASAVQPEQLEQPTPCSDWTVRDLLRHMVGGTRSFRAVVEGRPAETFEAEIGDADLSRSYRDGADALIAAWREPGRLERTMTMFGGEVPATMPLGLQVTEAAVHAWDLATATGQDTALDPEVAEAALAFTTANLGPQWRGRAFGAEREAPPGAGPYQRLAAFTGREVQPPG